MAELEPARVVVCSSAWSGMRNSVWYESVLVLVVFAFGPGVADVVVDGAGREAVFKFAGAPNVGSFNRNRGFCWLFDALESELERQQMVLS